MFLLRRKRLEQCDALESHQARLSAEGTKFGDRGGEPNKVVGLWHCCTQGQGSSAANHPTVQAEFWEGLSWKPIKQLT